MVIIVKIILVQNYLNGMIKGYWLAAYHLHCETFLEVIELLAKVSIGDFLVKMVANKSRKFVRILTRGRNSNSSLNNILKYRYNTSVKNCVLLVAKDLLKISVLLVIRMNDFTWPIVV